MAWPRPGIEKGTEMPDILDGRGMVLYLKFSSQTVEGGLGGARRVDWWLTFIGTFANVAGVLSFLLSLLVFVLDRHRRQALPAVRPPERLQEIGAGCSRRRIAAGIPAYATFAPAPMLKRTVAFVVDGLLPYIWLLLYVVVIAQLSKQLGAVQPPTPQTIGMFVVGLVTPLLGLGMLLVGWALAGVSPGKYLFGIRICTMHGSRRIGWRKALARAIGLAISLLVFWACWFVPFFSRKRQAAHDLLVGTYVCEVPDDLE